MATVDIIETGLQPTNVDTSGHATSWPAIFAGAAAAAALSLILLILGTGLGLSAVSPWANRGVSAGAISWSTIIWISFMAFASSGLGGYIAGRLRARWPAVHVDEVYFRDTAHGFLAWAVATLVAAAVLTSAIGTVAGTGASVGTAAATAGAAKAALQQTGSASVAKQADQQGAPEVPVYTVDSLFRAPSGTAENGDTVATAAANKVETARIFANSIHAGPLSTADTQYAAQLIAQSTGISQQDAEARVTSTYAAVQKALQDAEAKAKQVADQARRDAAYTALWVFVSLLIGAFFASLMATVGGRRRDQF